MTLLGLLILLIVAAFTGACGEMIAGAKLPGGWIGSILAGFIGAWIGGMLFHYGPSFAGIQILPAITGAALFVLAIRLLRGAARSRPVV